ncbi:kinase-like domain-containing protein [Scleroderma yunnanense]
MGEHRVAIRTSRTGPPNDESTLKKLLRVVHLWSKLNHPNVLALLGITTDFDMTVSTVSPWMEKGNAHDYVQNTAVDPRPLIEGIAKGMHYLHNHEQSPIFHGNLNGTNVLISNDGRPLLTDFSLSYIVHSSFSMTVSSTGRVKGISPWMAPELLEGGEPSAEADVWAFGMTALELFTRKRPFHEVPTIAGLFVRISSGRTPDRPSTEDTCARMTNE